MKYFELLPKLDYNNTEVRNIFKHYILASEVDRGYLQKYVVTEYETLEKISYKLYDTTDYWWILAIVNDFKDIIFDIPLSSEMMKQIATEESKKYPVEQQMAKYVEIYEQLEAENDAKREIDVVNPRFMSQILTQVMEGIKSEKTDAIRLENKKKILKTLEALESYYDKATADKIIDRAEQSVLQVLIDSTYYQYQAAINGYDSSVTGYDDVVEAWSQLNQDWVALSNDWNSEYKQVAFGNSLSDFSTKLEIFRKESQSFEIEELAQKFINGDNGYVLDLNLHMVGDVAFADYVGQSNGITVWSGIDSAKPDLMLNEPDLAVDDLYVASDSLKEYRFDGASWVELINADYAQALADVDGKRTIFVTTPTTYKANDLWIPESDTTVGATTYNGNEIYIATTDSQSFVESHWRKATNYTDDTVANLAIAKIEDMAADGKLTPPEKATWRDKWIEIEGEHSSILTNAPLHDIGVGDPIYDDYITAKDDLEAYLINAGVWSAPDDTYTIIGTEMTDKTATYYNKFQNLVAHINLAASEEAGEAALLVLTKLGDFEQSNNNKSTTPATPLIATTSQTALPNGNCTVTATWTFDGVGDAYDVDGFIVKTYTTDDSSPYTFGTDVLNETSLFADRTHLSISMANIPRVGYINIAIQSYRAVNDTIDESGILYSSLDVADPLNISIVVPDPTSVSMSLI